MAEVDKTAIVILGNQLLADHPAVRKYPNATILMIEADNLFRKLPYHKHKLILILASMRNYKKHLEGQKRKLLYVKLQPKSNYKKELIKLIESRRFNKLAWMKSSDKGPNALLKSLANKLKIESDELENEQFLTPSKEAEQWFESKNNPIMDNFYRWQRKRMNILMHEGQPKGGKWSYDYLNRKPLPKNIESPKIPKLSLKNSKSAIDTVEKYYSKNPGNADNFWLPTTHEEARAWFKDFIKHRFENFGIYEDAMKSGEAFLFHSLLSPMLNIGLLTPKEVLDEADKVYQRGKVPLNSYEGFVRQIIGWREYMHGLYMYKEKELDRNYFGFKKKLEPWWYGGEVPEDLELPVREVLKTTFEYGYNHHIERLMVLGNWFLLNGYDPNEVYKWFSSMYVDAYEWVMIPNVMGMSQYADGGFTATKPYISGGNYLQKMGKWWPSLKEAQASKFTELYWSFLETHSNKFKNNPRMSLVLAQAKKHKKSS
jgi:deoxyribodipyrimidine photolyase-related protein